MEELCQAQLYGDPRNLPTAFQVLALACTLGSTARFLNEMRSLVSQVDSSASAEPLNEIMNGWGSSGKDETH
jgi:hypothetical protein